MTVYKLIKTHIRGWYLTPKLLKRMMKIIRKNGLDGFVRIHEECTERALSTVGLPTQVDAMLQVMAGEATIWSLVKDIASKGEALQDALCHELLLASEGFGCA